MLTEQVRNLIGSPYQRKGFRFRKPRTRTSRALKLVLSVLFAASAVPFHATPIASGSESETVKIGVHTSLTGPLPEGGFAAHEAAKLAAVDFSGFEIGGVPHDIELVVVDDEFDSAVAVDRAQELVDAGVVGVIGPLWSGAAFAALPIYEAAGIPVISGSATSPSLTDGTYANFFRTALRNDLQGEALALWAIELGFARIALVDQGDDYSLTLGDAAFDALDGEGVDVLRLTCAEGEEDFSAQVGEIEASAAEAVIFTGYYLEAGLLREQLLDAGLGDVRFMGGDGIKSDEIADAAGGATNAVGMLCTYAGLIPEQMPGYADFAERFEVATGVEPGPYAENNYDALGALVEAIADAQSTEGAEIIAALFDVDYDGVMGTLGFDESGDLTVDGQAGPDLIGRFRFNGQTWVPYEAAEDLAVLNIAGGSRYETAVLASKEAYPDGADTVVIATGMNWPDALGGTSLAGVLDAPILLVGTNSIPTVVMTEIDRLGAQRAVILGGTGAVGPAVESALRTKLGTTNVERIWGQNRYLTANAIAREVIETLGVAYDGTAFVATGGNFPDALAAAPLAAAQKWPLFLADPSSGLSDATKNAMTGVTDVLILGGTAVVSPATQTYLGGRFGTDSVERLSGDDRYETAVKVSAHAVGKVGHTWDRVGITTGVNFPDALAGGVLQGKEGSVMLLTPSATLNTRTAKALSDNKDEISTVTFFGGTNAVTQPVRNAALAAAGVTP